MQSMPNLPPGSAPGNQAQPSAHPTERGAKVRAASTAAPETSLPARPGTFKQAIGFSQRQATPVAFNPQTQSDDEATTLPLHLAGAEPQLPAMQSPDLSLKATGWHQAGAPAVRSDHSSASNRISALPLTKRLPAGMQHATAPSTEPPGKFAVLAPQGRELLSGRPEAAPQLLSTVSGHEHTLSAPSQQPPQPAAPSATRAVWANVPMDPSPGKWGEQMLQVLQDRVHLQASQQMQEARIRLDPPDLGKLDLVVRVDGDRLNVQINANHSAVRDALVQVSDRLRAELAQQQFVHVDVNVGTGDQGRGEHTHTRQDEDNAQPVIQQASETPATSIAGTHAEHWLSTTA